MCSDDVAISVKNLTKRYRIFGHPGDRIKQALTFGQVHFHREFTALEDVSFEVKRGETVGIIGRNGSGKSTLLQLICGILKPTSGTVQVNGRVSALLELGAGFNHEFTGKENVYFQGALVGFTKKQMDKRFNDIAEFADIGDFIDQPVRVYSNGMFVRLAFAMATSLDAEIIAIDEAIAVGDIAFQARCFDRIKQLKDRGTTFLLVSHAMSQILSNSDSALLLDAGAAVVFSSDVASVVSDHEAMSRNTATPQLGAVTEIQVQTRGAGEKRFGTFEAVIREVDILQGGISTALLKSGEATILRFSIEASRSFDAVVLGASIRQPGTGDLWGDNNLLANRHLELHAGLNVVEYAFRFPFSSGEYLLYCGLAALESKGRIELDQRWPLAKLVVMSERPQVGIVHSPVTATVEA